MPKRSKNEKVKDKFKAKYKANNSSKTKPKSGASTNPDRRLKAKQQDSSFSHFRSKSTIKLLNMYNDKRDEQKAHQQISKPSRINPDRKWFGNVRTIDQKSLENFRIEMAQRSNDPKSILIKARKLPMSLLTDPVKENKIKILDIEKYEDTFGPTKRRKKVKLNSNTYEDMQVEANQKDGTYDKEKDHNFKVDEADMKKMAQRDKRMTAGQSQRIWEELYKVLDSSDVVCQVIDSRDPLGTRSHYVEEYLKKHCPTKHLVLILNKSDLVPQHVTVKWMKYLNKEHPTIVYHASLQNSFGKGSLINLLRQFDNFHRDKKNISVGFIGYPNVGKSAVINSLKSKAVCKSAPIPGETRVWQYVHLTKRIYLIDCPGVVYQNEGKDDTQVVLKGCIRAEKVDDPIFYIDAIIEKCKREQLLKIYEIEDWVDTEEFLKNIAIKRGKLGKGGEPDQLTAAKTVLMDWQRGHIPYHTVPPKSDEVEEKLSNKRFNLLEYLNKVTIDTLQQKYNKQMSDNQTMNKKNEEQFQKEIQEQNKLDIANK